MRVSNVHSSPTFGMAIKIPDPYSADKLQRLIKSGPDMKKFTDLIASQEKNKFHIDLGMITYNGKERLRGYIYNGRDFYKETTDLNHSDISLNPLKFIEAICKKANEIEAAYDARVKASDYYRKIN